MASLWIKVPGKEPKTYKLHKRVTCLGSDAECDIVLPDPVLAPSFAHIDFDGNEWNIATLAKDDEFLVNGKRRRRHKLGDDDRLLCGSIELAFSSTDPTRIADEAKSPVTSELEAYRKLHEFSARLLENYDLSELLSSLMDFVIDVTNASKGFLILMEGGRLDVKVARNLKAENIADAVSHLSDAIIAKVIASKQPLIVSDAMHDDEFKNSLSVMNLKLTSVMCAPLIERGNLIGAIYVGNDSVKNRFSEATMPMVTVLCAQASLLIRNALLVNELQLDNQLLHDQLENLRFGSIVGSSPVMQELFKRVAKVATTDVNVLITGETGTGKELVAREIHARSPRAKGPFISINCGAIPEGLLESELFGHVRGAFTGAVANRPGKFHAADKGTLFLDEIGEMPLPLQVKILRAIQEKTVIRVGDARPERVDIRIIAATNRDLEGEIKAGRFREDLYYRLNVISFHIPPLRERGEDISVLANYLLSRFSRELEARVRGFAPEAALAIKRYGWPGNIRELENRIKKALILASGAFIGPEDLDLAESTLPPILSLADAKERFQRQYINEILALNAGNRTKTARDLGVDPRTIFRHLEKEGSSDLGDEGLGDPAD